MTATLETLDGLKRKLTMTIDADAFKTASQKKIDEAARTVQLKGFRPGKVPANVIQQKFGRSILLETAASLIDSTFKAEIESQKIKLASAPQIDFDHEAVKPGESFYYTATFEIYPTVTLKDLTDVEIESEKGEVTDSDISAMLIKMRTQHAEWVDVDRAAKLGDRVKIDFDGEIDGKPLEQGSAKEHTLELGSHSMIPGFEDGIIGVKKGETKTIHISFPADYHVENLKGKPVNFKITIHHIQEPKLPELNDAFAEKMGVKEGLDALKKQIHEKMQLELNEKAHANLKESTLDKLMSLNNIDVPVALIDSEIQHLQNMTRQQMRQYMGKDQKFDVSKFPLAREPFEADAKKRVVLGLLLAEVIKAASITVDQQKVQDRLHTIASQYGDVAQILPIIQKNQQMVADVEAYVLEEQAIQTLLSKARVSEVKKSYDSIMNSNVK